MMEREREKCALEGGREREREREREERKSKGRFHDNI